MHNINKKQHIMIDNENLMLYSLFTAVKKLNNNTGHFVDLI